MKYVALYVNGKYNFGCINEQGRFEYRNEVNANLFHVVSDIESEMAKTFAIPNLGYNECENGGYEIFDKSVLEYYEYEVPVYARVFDKMILTKKKISHSIPTQETVDAARDMYSKIMEEIFKNEHKEEIAKLRKKVIKGDGIAFVNREDYPKIDQFLQCSEDLKKLFNYQFESYIIGIVQNDPMKVLKIKIPENIVGRVIGKGGRNIKEMCEILGVKRIEVIAI